jgi:hypothetical protein
MHRAIDAMYSRKDLPQQIMRTLMPVAAAICAAFLLLFGFAVSR